MRVEKLGRPIEILLVEDNLDDAEFVQLALEEAKVVNRLHHAKDGEAAITFLKDSSNPRPDIILLDLNMPKMDGREVLQIIKHDASLQTIPVVVLTTSGLEEDVQQSYRLYTNCYLRKPIEFEDFVQVLTRFHNFWFQIVELPSVF